MKKSFIIIIIGFVWVAASAQAGNLLKPGMPNTLSLSNGEVVYRLNGEWATCIEHFGEWEQFGVFPDIIEIQQSEAAFVGATLLDSSRNPKGTKKLRGELTNDTFKFVQIITRIGAIESHGKILDNGNKILVEHPNRLKITLIRKPGD
ncbi:MAG: hypothetical protein D3926_01805 [Desulfobacteraceae bacterium]|nr:MAG: hypothetical protein D3926_01805 [Desulfobacteraceae bacterium]